MSSSEFAIRADRLGKVYRLYDRPVDRLKQMLSRGRRRYGREFHALDDVSFELRRGEVLGLVGRNGAGKSTLLQMICGTLTPSAGSVVVNGRIAALLELGAGFNPDFSGRENIYLNASVLGLSRQEIDARYGDIVDFSGIDEFIHQPVKTYSSGMYMRLAFAIATSVAPDILIIDEALSVGDGAFARKSFDRIMALKERGATILFCSHSMYHIEAICNRALWLERGRQVMFDTPARVTQAFSTSLMVDADSSVPAHPDKDAGSAAPITSPDHRAESAGRTDRAGLAAHPLGQARFEHISATANGTRGTRLCLRSGESELRIRIEFSSDPAIPVPSLAFGIETSTGLSISSAGSHYDGVLLQRRPDGRGTVELVLPALPLMRGEYTLSLFLGCERMIHIYDHAPCCIHLEVLQSGIERGVVFLQRYWHCVEDAEPVTAPVEAPPDAVHRSPTGD